MTSAYRTREDAVLEVVVPELEAEGFEVFLRPSGRMLPGFLKGTQPDAIAIGKQQKLVVQVVAGGVPTDARLENIRRLVAERQDWTLRVFYAPPPSSERAITVPSRTRIEKQLDRVAVAADEIGPAASLLAAWSAFEAAARALIPDDLRRPQPSARLLEVLAFEGYLSPDEADALRRLGQLRNEAAHGGLDVDVSQGDLNTLLDATRSLLDQQEREPAGAHPAIVQ